MVKKEKSDMIIKSDWHIHSEFSYDLKIALEEIMRKTKEFGYEKIGITDHVTFNDEKVSVIRLQGGVKF